MKHAYVFGLFLAVMLSVQSTSLAQPTNSQGVIATVTAKIIAIDSDARIVTLQDAQGNVDSLKVGPEVTRFDALKVGDTVTFRYQEAVAYGIVKPGTAGPASQASPTLQRSEGAKPGGTISRTLTALVTITAIDPAVPSVTVKTQDGHTITMEVADKANLANVKVGDTVQVTYSQALTISVQ